MKPVIGIISRVEYPGGTGKMAVNETIRRAVVAHGGNPICILLPQDIEYTMTKYSEQPEITEEEKDMLKKEMDFCDGILFPGGFATNKAERFILNYVIQNNKPVLGICLGMQILGSYGNDTLSNEPNVDEASHKSEEKYVHYVTLDKESMLYKIIGKERFMVNSRHKYHLIPNDNYVVSSVSDDNIVESIEFKDKKYIIGVQWHPEDLDDEQAHKLFNSFIDACK
jgi:gamma-glutamyl-gamma-aminobutyrate hydrolase PuuD